MQVGLDTTDWTQWINTTQVGLDTTDWTHWINTTQVGLDTTDWTPRIITTQVTQVMARILPQGLKPTCMKGPVRPAAAGGVKSMYGSADAQGLYPPPPPSIFAKRNNALTQLYSHGGWSVGILC